MKHLIFISLFSSIGTIFVCEAQSFTETIKKLEPCLIEGRLPSMEDVQVKFSNDSRTIEWCGSITKVDCESMYSFLALSLELSQLGYSVIRADLYKPCDVPRPSQALFINCTKRIILTIEFVMSRDANYTQIAEPCVSLSWGDPYASLLAVSWCD